MNIAIDVILVGIVLVFAFIGYKRGFFATVMKLVAFVLAQIGAYFFYYIPSDIMYDRWLLPGITSMIEKAILSEGRGKTLAELFSLRNESFLGILDRFSSAETVEGFYNSSPEQSVSELSRFMAEPLARSISDVLGFLAVFIILLILLILLGLLINKLCDLPVLKTANAALGTALGILTGLCLAWILAAVLGAVLPLLCSAYPDIFGTDIIEKTMILKLFYEFNPLTIFNLQ